MEISLVGIHRGSQVAVWVEPYPKHHSRKYNHENPPEITTDPLINVSCEVGHVKFNVPLFEQNQHIIILRVRHLDCLPIEMLLDMNDFIDGPMVFIHQEMELYYGRKNKPCSFLSLFADSL